MRNRHSTGDHASEIATDRDGKRGEESGHERESESEKVRDGELGVRESMNGESQQVRALEPLKTEIATPRERGRERERVKRRQQSRGRSGHEPWSEMVTDRDGERGEESGGTGESEKARQSEKET